MFFWWVLGTKLGAVLPLRMRHKAMQLVLGRLAGYKTERFEFYSRVGFRRDVWASFATFWARN